MGVCASDSSVEILDDAGKKRHRRQVRMEIMRRKRANLPREDSIFLANKRQRIDASYPSSSFASPVVTSSEVPVDAAKMRQLKNRESAERSRLKKDNLVDSLTCQVCECYVTLTDLLAENKWLSDLASSQGGRCSPEPLICYSPVEFGDSASIGSGHTDVSRSPLSDFAEEDCCVGGGVCASSNSSLSSGLGSSACAESWSSEASEEYFASIIEDFDLLLEGEADCRLGDVCFMDQLQAHFGEACA